jgi:pyruvate/2-oxoglutarate dehydrogenase complex dihydrolipoamide dehydrogenase (E3) component/uncharacterized membrane protein YdjX (TVP38/TMEM64 family)
MKRKSLTIKIAFGILLLILFSIFYHFELHKYLELKSVKDNLDTLKKINEQEPVLFSSYFFGAYVLVAALSLPGAAMLTLLSGAIFGFYKGLVLASFASSIGATLAFLGSRFFLSSWVQKKFSKVFVTFNEGIKKDGDVFLIGLRLVPAVPFFVVNLLMGLFPISTIKFYILSQLGMFIGTAVYVNAGTQLGYIQSTRDILSFNILISFTLLGFVPFCLKKFYSYYLLRKKMIPFVKPIEFNYNTVVIGGGSAGLVASYITSAAKAKVALIEKHKMGGDCLNTGCVPSKSLIRIAKAAHDIRKAHDYGLKAELSKVDLATVMKRVQSVIKKIEPHDSAERYQSLGVDCFSGSARIISPYEVVVNGKNLTTKTILIASGASPFVPSIEGLDLINYKTSDNLWSLNNLPDRIAILGGGPIGCELAQAFSRLGSKVTIIEKDLQILNREDSDIVEKIEEKFIEEDIKIVKGFITQKIITSDKGFKLHLSNNEDQKEIEFDELIIALGRKANLENLGLEDLSIEANANGTIKADEFLRTNYPNIFVCGDVAGPYQFTHMAAHQAWYAAVNAMFMPFWSFKVDYSIVPMCTFVSPELARVGLNEKEAKLQNISYEVTTYDMKSQDRALADGENFGIVKVLTPPKSDKILGVTILGPRSGEVIAEFVLAMKHGLGLSKILGTVHIYPTLTEANKAVAGNWRKKNMPEKLMQFAESFHEWRRNN